MFFKALNELNETFGLVSFAWLRNTGKESLRMDKINSREENFEPFNSFANISYRFLGQIKNMINKKSKKDLVSLGFS